VIFRYGEEIIYPDDRYPEGRRGWVVKPPVGRPVPPYYEDGAYVVGLDSEIQMWFDAPPLKLANILDRIVEEL
jgi:hypothetical protein